MEEFEHVEPTYRTITLTPELAREFLRSNSLNRNLNMHVVERFAEEMARGNWLENGDAIRRSIDGVLLDGQHRCAAVAKSGVAIRCILVEGLPKSTIITIDAGRPRSFADYLKIQHHENADALAALTRVLYLYEIGKFTTGTPIKPTFQQLKVVLDNHHDDMVSSLSVAASVRRRIRVSPSVLALGHYVFARIDPADAKDFFERLRDGVDLPEGNPILTLRRSIERDMTAQSGRRMDTVLLMAILIKAWNAYRRGDEIRLLAWKRGGAAPERFPVPE